MPKTEEQRRIEAFVRCACAGDIREIRAQVAAGLDLSVRDEAGTTLLEAVIDELTFVPNVPKYEVVKEMLRLGADPRGLNSDGFGPLFSAVLNMDAEMLRILLDAGADPNVEKMDSETESLYDWAEFQYRYEVWGVNPPKDATGLDRADDDAWLRHLDRLAIKDNKRRPNHLQLLRERGARSMRELVQRAGHVDVRPTRQSDG